MLSDCRHRVRTCQKQGLHYTWHSMQAELQVQVSFPLPQVPWGHMAGWGRVQVDTVCVDLCYGWKCEPGESMTFKMNVLLSWRRCYFSPQGCLLWIPPWGTVWVQSEEQPEHLSLGTQYDCQGCSGPMVGYLFQHERTQDKLSSKPFVSVVTCINSMHMNL